MARKVRIEGQPRHLKRQLAISLVAQGLAVWVDKWAVRYLRPPSHPIRCGQGRAYEGVAIEPHPTIYLGGLTRTESKPAKIPAYKGARVGHQ